MYHAVQDAGFGDDAGFESVATSLKLGPRANKNITSTAVFRGDFDRSRERAKLSLKNYVLY